MRLLPLLLNLPERIRPRTRAGTKCDADQRQASEDKTAVQRRSVDSLIRNTVFGQEIFSTKNLTFAPSYNMATPPSYVLGPGDEVIIEVWGEAESRVQEKISPEGSISRGSARSIWPD